MSWLLFMDESGHDHKNMPFEVRGGIAIHSSQIWPFATAFSAAEQQCFGCRLADFGTEIKGSKLLERKRFEWAEQLQELSDDSRRKGVRRFLTTKAQELAPTRRDFTAFGQASLFMADGIFTLLKQHGAVLFASMIPRGCKMPPDYAFENYLRKDHIFLQERFFYFLESKQEHGIFVMDATEKHNDRRFVNRLRDYYTKTQSGRQRTQWIVPEPLFVDSELSVAVQSADLLLYTINWGFRLDAWQFQGQTRQEIASRYGRRLSELQFVGDGYREGETFRTYGIVHVPDPYTSRK